MRAVRQRARRPEAPAAASSRLQRVEDELGRLAEAIAPGPPLDPRRDPGSRAAARRPQAQLEHLDGLARALPCGDGDCGRPLRRLADWQGLLGRQPEARQILRKLSWGGSSLTPKPAEGATTNSRGQASYGGLLAGL